MKSAYARGDHQRARSLAQALLASDEAEAQQAATDVLKKTEPDRIIEAFALLGLGVIAFLVYNYVL